MVYGYARVSTHHQDLGRQISALEGAGCDVIFQERISGGKRARPELSKLIERLQPGDIVVVQKLDRLGRSLSHLMSLINIFQEQKVGFKSLTDSFDTTTAQGTLIFQIMGAIAEFERSLIRERIRDGLAHKRAKGKVLGRPGKWTKKKVADIIDRHTNGETTLAIQTATGIPLSTIYRIINKSKLKSQL